MIFTEEAYIGRLSNIEQLQIKVTKKKRQDEFNLRKGEFDLQRKVNIILHKGVKNLRGHPSFNSERLWNEAKFLTPKLFTPKWPIHLNYRVSGVSR